VAVAAWTWYHIDRDRRTSLAHWDARIASIAEDRARLVGDWLRAHRADAEILALHPAVRTLLGGDGQRHEAAIAHLDRAAAASGHVGVWLFDQRGKPLARSTRVEDPGPDAVAWAVAVLGSRRPAIDLPEQGGARRLLVAVPVPPDGADRDGGRAPLGVVTVVMRAETALYPLLAERPGSSATGESLLFALEGDQEYLSPLRQPTAGWGAVARSVHALRDRLRLDDTGGARVAEVNDYRAVPVLAAVRPVDGTAWGLVLKVDRAEALADFLRAGQLAGAAAAFLLLALAGVLVTLWRERERVRLTRLRMEQERALFNLRGYAEKVVASVPSGLLVLAPDLRVVSVNPAFLETFGLVHQDVAGRHLHDVIWAESLAARARAVVETGVPQHGVLMDLHVGRGHETRPALMTLTGLRMAGEEPGHVLLIVQDLTEVEQREAARRASEQRFHELVQGLDAIVWEADAATLRYSFVSQPADRILGYPLARWREDPDWAWARVHPADRERVAHTSSDAIARGADHGYEYRALAADGRELWLRDIVHVVRDADGRAVQLRGLTVDVTDRKRQDEALRQAEDQLRQAQKMDAIGQLAGGIAHDFNNLLMVMRGDSDLILRRLDGDHPLRQNAEGIRDAADQAAALTRQLLAFSRKHVLAPAVLDLNTVVSSIQKMLERLIGETITLVTALGADLGRIQADPGQVEQMVLNLVVNARDAMPEGGTLTIRTANAAMDEREARRRGGVRPGEYVLLEVADTGIGMDAHTREHLFEPFFTTKSEGKGTGLGLSTVYGIVNQAGGHIRVESELGRGTTFAVLFPRLPAAMAAAPPPPPSAAGASPRPGRRGETVLLVEDAGRVRAVVREILETEGYRVLEARHGPEALRIAAEHAGPIHLLVTDVVMPHMSGRELARRLGAQRPAIPVLYMSGYTDDALERHDLAGPGQAFLAKPFTPDALGALVRRLLDAPQAATRVP